MDLIVTSANNYYEGVTQKEVEEYYAARIDTTDPKPVSYGLNSKMVKDASGRITERFGVSAACTPQRSRRLSSGSKGLRSS